MQIKNLDKSLRQSIFNVDKGVVFIHEDSTYLKIYHVEQASLKWNAINLKTGGLELLNDSFIVHSYPSAFLTLE